MKRRGFASRAIRGSIGLGGLGLASVAVAALRRRRARSSYDFGGKVAVITGGSRGLGLLLARSFAAEGARLAILARDDDELRRAERELVSRGAEVYADVCDIRERDQVEAFVQSVLDVYGTIDVLVNNAGIVQAGPEELMTREDYEDAMAVHFRGPLQMVEAVVATMRERGEGRIVNVTSIGGKISIPHLLPYCASKFALVGYSEGLRGALARDGILVTTVCPGLMRTGSPRHGLFKGRHRAEYAWFAISDSLPLVSMDAERAARRIVEACRRGQAELVLGVPARLAVTANALFPGLVSKLNTWVERLLPDATGGEPVARPGYESESDLAPSRWTSLTEKAARENNEVA